MTYMPNPAALLPEPAPRHLLAAEAEGAIEIALAIKSSKQDIRSWVNFPLINATGEHDDLLLQPYLGLAQRTMFAARLPGVVRFIDTLQELGLDIRYARIAVLLRRDVITQREQANCPDVRRVHRSSGLARSTPTADMTDEELESPGQDGCAARDLNPEPAD